MNRQQLSAAVGVAFAIGLVFTTPAMAAPVDGKDGIGVAHAACGTNKGDYDNGSWRATARTAANQRSGSSTSCLSKGAVQPTDRLDYHCYTNGNDGYTWTFLRNDRTDVTGWVRDDLLTDNGSYVLCP